MLNSDCLAVGRAVASDTRDPRFESSHRKFYLLSTVLSKLHRKDENKEKEAGNGPFFAKDAKYSVAGSSMQNDIGWKVLPS